MNDDFFRVLDAIAQSLSNDDKTARSETELDAFGHVDDICNQLSAANKKGGTIKLDEVMQKLEEMGLGSMPEKEWRYLVQFRLSLPPPYAAMLRDCLFQVCNGRVTTAPKTFADIHGLHIKGHAWPKIFLVVQMYCDELLDEGRGGG